jgi:putative transposase
MNSAKIKSRLHSGLEDIDAWELPNVLGMDESSRVDFETKKTALLKYVQGISSNEIADLTGISRQHLHYLVKRCTETDERGHTIGYSGLIKWKHITKRNENIGKLEEGKPVAGSLQALFQKYDSLEVVMRKLILDRIAPDSTKVNTRLTWHHIHNIFLQQCTALKILPPTYPFCSDSNGKASLIAWGKTIQNSQTTLGQFHPHSDMAKSPPSQCFERVEVDGHFVDVNWVLQVPGLNGEGVVNCKVSRLWLVALLECKSTAVIGYSISLGKNYNASDVAMAVRSSLVPWKPRNLSISTITYKPGECLPNALMPELSYVCYDELWLDNAKSHLSDLFLTVLERSVNAVPVFGPKKSPNVRPRIEQLFDLLEEAGIHCLDGTTGSNPSDPRKSNQQKDQYFLKLDTLYDLIDLLIVRYNTGIAPGTTIARNDVLKRAVERETSIFRQIPISKRINCIEYTIYDEAVIGVDERNPVVRWKNARYYGMGLTSNLIGKKVLIMANSDIREIQAVLLGDGTPLGALIVERRWRDTPHTLYTRQTVRRYMTNNGFISHAADIPLAFRKHMENEAKINATHHRSLARLCKEQETNSKNDNNEAVKPNYPSHNNPVDDIPIKNSTNPLDEKQADELDELIKNIGTLYR